jgi:3-deoxy-D-arabino-heptulosonate 7-phosphate (DAHP) synthase class II
MKNWKEFNEGVLDFFSKENQEKRKSDSKNKYINDIDKYIKEFNTSVKMLNAYKSSSNSFEYLEEFISCYSLLVDSLDKFYNKFVKNNENNFQEYKDQYEKINSVLSQVKYLKANLSGWSIGYDPQEILEDAKEKFKIHARRILYPHLYEF